MKPPAVQFESHPPERRRPGTTLYGCGCCCCCCCCLHAVGGVIGAAVAPAIGSGRRPSLVYDEEDEAAFAPVRPASRGVKRADPAVRSGLPVRRPLDVDEDRPPVRLAAGSSLSAVRLFWWVTAALSVLVLLMAGGYGGTGILVGAVILALVLPVLQLASAVLASLLLLASGRTDRSYQLRRLGKVALGTIVGTGAGILAMVLLGVLLSR